MRGKTSGAAPNNRKALPPLDIFEDDRTRAPSDIVRVAPPIAERPTYVWNGVTITRQFARRPVVHRLEASRPRGSVVGDGI